MALSQAMIVCLTYVEDLEAGDIEHTDEVLSLLFGVQSFVQLLHHPLEQPVVHGFGHGTDRIGHLVLVSALGHHLGTDLYPGLTEILVEVGGVDAEQVSHFLALFHAVRFALFLSGSLLELHRTDLHDSRSDLVHVVLLLFAEAQHVEGFLYS